jgi:nucleotide-binding universal stress UspA family protein
MKIIVGVDGSEASGRALEWCAAHAEALGAEVVAAFAIDLPIYAASGFGFAPIPVPFPEVTEAERERLHETINGDWCAPLTKAGVTFRGVVIDGSPAVALMALADKENADLVVVGRRGRGGFVELLLGSTTHHLSHHLDRPLVIVP